MFNALRNLTYRRGPASLAPALRIHGPLKSAYFRLGAPRKRVRANIAGMTAEFFVRSPSELRMLERAVQVRNSGASERELIELFLGAVHRGDTVYDIGANVGLYTIFLSKRVGPEGHVIAFEPDSRNHLRLQENIQLNGLVNVISFRKALGDERRIASLYIHKDNPGQSTLLTSQDPRFREAETVEVVNGDACRETKGLPVPRLVKMDVEGYEYSVPHGLRQTLTDPACEFLGCEVHPRSLPPGVTAEHMCEMLRSFGFDRIEAYARGRERHLACYK